MSNAQLFAASSRASLLLIVITYVVALVGPVAAGTFVWMAWLVKDRRMLCSAVICGAVFAYGWVAFMGQVLGAMGGMPFLGAGFEWPTLFTGGAVRDSLGRSYVPHDGASRIQVYDEKGRFVRGWFIAEGRTGAFKLHVRDDGHLDVFTARGDWHLVYRADGRLLSKGHYHPPEGYGGLPTGPKSDIKLAPAWYLLPLTHPVVAWVVGVLGMAGLLIHRWVRRRNPRRDAAKGGACGGARGGRA